MMIVNASNFISTTNAIMARVNMGLGPIVEEGANAIVEFAIPKVPIETGELIGSGNDPKLVSGGPLAKAVITYEAYNRRTGYNYAMIQHENEKYNHRHGEDHYLLNAVTENSAFIISIWGEQIAVLIG